MDNVVEFPISGAQEAAPETTIPQTQAEDSEVARLNAEENARREQEVAVEQAMKNWDLQKYTLIGYPKDETLVVKQSFEIRVPKGMANHDQAAMTVWQVLEQQGGLTQQANPRLYRYYPTELFKHIDLVVEHVTGTSVA